MEVTKIYIIKTISGQQYESYEHEHGFALTEEEAKEACARINAGIPRHIDEKLLDLYEELYDEWYEIEEKILDEKDPSLDYSKIPTGQVTDMEAHGKFVDAQNERIDREKAAWYFEKTGGRITKEWLEYRERWEFEQYENTSDAYYTELKRI